MSYRPSRRFVIFGLLGAVAIVLLGLLYVAEHYLLLVPLR